MNKKPLTTDKKIKKIEKSALPFFCSMHGLNPHEDMPDEYATQYEDFLICALLKSELSMRDLLYIYSKYNSLSENISTLLKNKILNYHDPHDNMVIWQSNMFEIWNNKICVFQLCSVQDLEKNKFDLFWTTSLSREIFEMSPNAYRLFQDDYEFNEEQPEDWVYISIVINKDDILTLGNDSLIYVLINPNTIVDKDYDIKVICHDSELCN